MTALPFQSYAQNGEDVVLHRALGHVTSGRYVEVGANHPTVDSTTRAFYELGWSGITVEPVPNFARLHREERPRDRQVEAAVVPGPPTTVKLHAIEDSGLSTLDSAIAARHGAGGFPVQVIDVATRSLDDILDEAGWADSEIHFMTIDVEGAEAGVLGSIDLSRWRPWVVVVEATAPLSTQRTDDAWEDILLKADYQLCLFDGLSKYYVAAEHAEQLGPALGYPACVLDNFVSPRERQISAEFGALRAEIDRLHAKVQSVTAERDIAEQAAIRWRTAAVSNWADAAVGAGAGAVAGNEALLAEIEALRNTLSWRITKPLRMLRERAAQGGA